MILVIERRTRTSSCSDTVARPAMDLLAVPELTRGIGIKLNGQVSLHRDSNCLASSHRILSDVRTYRSEALERSHAKRITAMKPQMITESRNAERTGSSEANATWTEVWHFWTVIIPRRSITGRLVFGKVWRRHDGRHWTYKKFVEFRHDHPTD